VSLASATVPLEVDSSRLFLSRFLLEEHKATPSIAKKLSELQSGAVAAMVASSTLTVDETAELATVAVGVPWASDADVNRVLAAFTVQSALPPGKRRRSQQDYTMVHHFLTARMWEAMLDPQTPSDVKLTALLGHLIKLGLRCPTEPTLKWLTSFWLVCSVDPAELGRLSVTDKTIRFKNTKVHFNCMRQRATDPPEWVGVLPPKPVDMLRSYPLVYTAAFPGDASPAPPGVSVELIAGFDMSYSCRGGLITLPLGFGGSSGTVSVASSSSSTSTDLQNMLMGFMQSMQANQQQMVQMMISPQSSLAPRTMTSMAALADRPFRQQGALMGFQPEVQQSRSTPIFEEVQDSPPMKGAAPLAYVEAAASETPLQERSIVAKEGGVANGYAPSVATGISDLFAMMQDRKEETKVKNQEAKAAKALEAKAAKSALAVKDLESDRAIAAIPPVAPKLAKSKGKGKAVADPPVAPKLAKAKGKGKMVKKEAVSEAAAVANEPNPKDLSEADKLKLAKARLSAKNGKIRKLAASDGWGCAKCRWRFVGCAQCKGKTFNGFVWNPAMKV
jgi:hypothetical protein